MARLREIRNQRPFVDEVANSRHRDRLLQRQRKSVPFDLTGVPYEFLGDNGSPAISIIRFSVDCQFVYSWRFKMITRNPRIPFGQTLTEVDLTVDHPVPGTPTVTPNPHTHNLIAGVTEIPMAIVDLRIIINGHDLTDALQSQFPNYPDNTANNYEIFPAIGTENDYDILKAAQDTSAIALQDIIKTGEDKLIEIRNEGVGAGLFNIQWLNYLQYSQTSR